MRPVNAGLAAGSATTSSLAPAAKAGHKLVSIAQCFPGNLDAAAAQVSTPAAAQDEMHKWQLLPNFV